MKAHASQTITETVRTFYEKCSFPGYEEIDSVASLIRKAETGLYAKLLDRNVLPKASVLDVGCGTGQLAIFLSLAHRFTVGADLSLNSLRKANAFASRLGLSHVHFCQMNLFQLPFKSETFDFVFCNGVLHHTYDAYKGFQEIIRLVKPRGYVIVGLYNKYGRLALDLRRMIFRLTKNRFQQLDHLVRRKNLDPEKKQIWFKDQYEHPHETKHTIDEVLAWFRANGIRYINAIPPIRVGDSFDTNAPLFEAQDPGIKFDHFITQLRWIFTQGKEGGFFILIGQKIKDHRSSLV